MSKLKIANFLMLSALTFWVYSVLTCSLTLNELGLFSSFGIPFYLALSLFIAASFVESSSTHPRIWVQMGSWLLVIGSLNLIPMLIGGTTRAEWATIANYRQVQSAIEGGRISNNIPELYLAGGFPSIILLFSAFFEVTHVPQLSFVLVYLDMFWEIIYLPFYLIIARSTLSRDQVWPFIWFIYLFQWLSFNGIEAQTLGFVGFLATVALLLALGSKLSVAKLAFVLLAALTVTSHGLSALLTLSVLSCLYLFRRGVSSRQIMVFILLLGTWLIFVAQSIIDVGYPAILEFSKNPLDIFQFGLQARVTSLNPAHYFLDLLRVSYTGAYLGVAAVGVLLVYFVKPSQAKFYFALIVGISMMGTLVGYGYGAEIIDKSLLFAAPAVAFFGVQMLRIKYLRLILISLLIISPSIYMINAYGNQYTDLIPHPQFSGFSYFQTYTAGSGTLSGNLLTWVTPTFPYSYGTPFLSLPSGAVPTNEFLSNPANYAGIAYEQLDLNDSGSIFPSGAPHTNHYIAVSLLDHRIYWWIYNNTRFVDEIPHILDTRTSLVYSSTDMLIWYSDGV